MPTLPVRELGKVGILADTNPYDLPINAFSSGTNIIFDEGKVQRAPVFKTLYGAFKSDQPYDTSVDTYAGSSGSFENALNSTSSARFVGSYNGSQEVVVVCDTDGSVREYPNGVLGVVTPTSGTLISNTEPWTHSQAAGLSVLSRKGMKPYIRNIKTDVRYSYMGGDWGTSDTANVVRGFGDFLLALNVTKAGIEYPTMVKWCNPLSYSPAISSVLWDPTNPAYVAGENVIGDLKTGIVDGLSLHNLFVIYSSDQVWAMEYTGSSFVFNFKRLFPTGGAINVNCVTEVEGKHLVFGVDDLYMHDGVTKKSLADERIRRKIFQAIDRTNASKCFVHHDTLLNLVYFCYVDKGSDLGFVGSNYCNRAAVYNYRNDTWSFMDLPNIAGAGSTNIDLTNSPYDKFQDSYNNFNNVYTSFDNVAPRVSIMLGVSQPSLGLSDSRVYAVDLPTIGLVALPIEPETVKTPFVERLGIDLDKEAQVSLRSYKMIKSIQPQVEILGDSDYITFQFGGQDNPNQPINWQDPVQFDHENDYKVDTRASGRYLAIRAYFPETEFFRWSAFDIEMAKTGSR